MKPNVLVVDDDPDILGIFTHLFETAGAKVSTAQNGQDAVEIGTEKVFDMIVLDVRMPKMDGITAAAALRDKGFKGAIIIATVVPSGTGRHQCKDIGVNTYLDKRYLTQKVVAALLEQHCAHLG